MHGWSPGSQQKRTPPWWSCFLGPATWLLQISSPHLREPMRKGLTKGVVPGFNIIIPTGREKKLLKKLNNFILYFISYQSQMPPKQWNQPPCKLPPCHSPSSITPLSLPLISGWLLCWFANRCPIKTTTYFIFIILALLHLMPHPNNGTLSSHTLLPGLASYYSYHLPWLPTFGWLLHVAA